MGEKSEHSKGATMRPVTATTRLAANGSTSLVVTAPLPCGLRECVAELHVTHKHGDTTRVHLSGDQRAELIEALGGIAIDLDTISDDARRGLILGLGGALLAGQ